MAFHDNGHSNGDATDAVCSALAKPVDRLDGAGSSFVSVTQSFNTATSMGRLTLNMLLSFAQFEREVTAERIRDKIAASKKKGLWMGATVPLGYAADGRSLKIAEPDAEVIRTIYDLYLTHRNVRLVNPLDDKIFRDGGSYDVAFAVFRNASTMRWHYISLPASLGLGEPAQINAKFSEPGKPDWTGPWTEIEIYYPGQITWSQLTDARVHPGADRIAQRVVDAALDRLAPGGRAAFVDYARPARWNLLRPVMRVVFALLEPFAAAMWRRYIRSFSSTPERFS